MKRSQTRRPRTPFRSFDTLECRRLLAGNVSAFIDGDILLVVGDSAANQVQVSGASSGQVTVEGVNTTINGSSAPFAVSGSFRRMTISLGDGDDQANLNTLSVSGSLSFFGGNGNDRLSLNAVEARYIHVQGNDGDDVIEFNGVIDRKSTYVYLGDGNDVLAVQSLSTGRNFKVFGGNGDDTFASNLLSAGRKFRLYLDNGNDQALLSGNTTVRKNTKIGLGGGNDFLGVLPQQNDGTAIFRKRVKLNAGSGDDTVVFDAGVISSRSSKLQGGAGTDAINTADANLHKRTQIRSFENGDTGADVVTERIDNVFSRLNAVGIDAEPFGDTDSSDIRLAVDQEPLSFIENDTPLAIDSTLEIIGPSTARITSATIEIQGGTDGEDTLLFDNTSQITGVFDGLVLALTGAASIADYQAALRTVRYSNSSENPSADDRTLNISLVTESASDPVLASRLLRVTPVDDSLQLTLPNAFGAIVEPISFASGSEISFTPEDADPDNEVTYQLDLESSGISASANQPTIDASTGEFTWTPSEAGVFSIRVLATNNSGESDQEEFIIGVDMPTTTTTSGLQVIDFEAGSSSSPTRSESVVVDYVGYLGSGEIFDRGDSVRFALTGVIEGFAGGIEGMMLGGRRRVIVPPNLGYGVNGQFGDNPITFDIELREIV